MAFAATFQRLRASLVKSAGTVVFGMEDGTVSIFGLIFGVAATTTSTQTVVIAGASGAVAAAVSMMAGVYLDAETTIPMLMAVFAGDSPVGIDELQNIQRGVEDWLLAPEVKKELEGVKG